MIHAVIVGIDKFIEKDLMELVKDIGVLRVIEKDINGGYEHYRKII